MKYSIDDKLPFTANCLYALQWFIVLLPCIVIMGAVTSTLYSNSAIDHTIYIQKVCMIVGLTSIVQVYMGHKLPLVLGPSSALLVGLLASQSAGIAANYTAIAVGGFFLAALAASGILKHIRQIFTPRIVAVVLILIAVSLGPVIEKLVFLDKVNSLFNIFFTFAFVAMLTVANTFLQGLWKSTVLVWGTLLGIGVYFIFYEIPTMSLPASQEIWSQFSFLLPSFSFDAGTVLAYIICAIALLVNEFGSIEAVGHMLNASNMPTRTTRGVVITGLSNICSGCCGIIGSVDFSLSSGIIASTGCASRYPLALAGAALIVTGCFPSLVLVLTHIPPLILGGLFFYLMSGQLAAGLGSLVEAKAITSFQHGLVLAVPIMAALLISFAPPSALEQLPLLIRPILGNGFVVGMITALLMEHGLLRISKQA